MLNSSKKQVNIRRERGFTLVEILVCVAIIAVLAALMFPVFSRAKNSAKETDAATNLRQIYMAIELYRSDNPDSIPFGTRDEMHLPLVYLTDDWEGIPGAPLSSWFSPCGHHPNFSKPDNPHRGGNILSQFASVPPGRDPNISLTYRAIMKHKNDAIILIDANCTSFDVDVYAKDDSLKKYLLVSLGGQFRSVTTTADIVSILPRSINNIEED